MDVKSPAEQLLFTTVRIEAGMDLSQWTGTGFFLHHEIDEGHMAPFVVTNKHVVKGAHNGQMIVHARDGDQVRLGEPIIVDLDRFSARWYGHPDPAIDICILPWGPIMTELQSEGKQVFYKAIGRDVIPSNSQLQELDAIEEVVFIGYPSGIYDTYNFTPIVRRGITATPPGLDYGGKSVFLIDGSVFPGSSGSPVFILNHGGYSLKDGSFAIGSRVLFLGVVAEVYSREEKAEIDFVEIPATLEPIIRTRQWLHLGIVYKPNSVLETIQSFLKWRQSGSE